MQVSFCPIALGLPIQLYVDIVFDLHRTKLATLQKRVFWEDAESTFYKRTTSSGTYKRGHRSKCFHRKLEYAKCDLYLVSWLALAAILLEVHVCL